VSGRLDATFAALAERRRKALVAFLVVGDPSLDESVELCVAAVEAGADVLELGVPFSDPTADGPAIARAAARAIRGGATLARVIDAAARVRARVAAPLVLFTYLNPVVVLGEERTVALAAAAGVDALLVVDLPPEEAAPLRALASARGLSVVPLVAPTSDAARVAAIAAASRPGPSAPRGFAYYVSVAGVTGGSTAGLDAARERAAAVRAAMDRPVVVGFGIDGAATARAAAGAPGEGPDGVVVGSALVRRVEAGATPGDRARDVRALVAELRAAIDAPTA
jgi:tryptophan synthase alpha chain